MHVNVSLIIEKLIHIKSGIIMSVGMTVKILNNIMGAKKIIFGILLHIGVKMVNK